jgi:hypothetical protein
MQPQERGTLEIQFQLRPLFSAPEPPRRRTPAAVESGKLPRITQVLALAIQFEETVRTGEAKDYADLARLGCVTRERISQIMKLRWLAPDIQAEILRLPRTPSGRFPICEARLRGIADELSWAQQRRLWEHLKSSEGRERQVARSPGLRADSEKRKLSRCRLRCSPRGHARGSGGRGNRPKCPEPCPYAAAVATIRGSSTTARST